MRACSSSPMQTSTDVVPMHASTPELQAAEADAKILAGGQEGVADWFGDSSRSMDCPPDQQQQVQGPGESSGGAAAAAGGSHVKEEGSVQQGGAAGSEQSGGQQPAGSQKQVGGLCAKGRKVAKVSSRQKDMQQLLRSPSVHQLCTSS